MSELNKEQEEHKRDFTEHAMKGGLYEFDMEWRAGELQYAKGITVDGKDDGHPILLEGFSRYYIFPSGRVYDRKRGRNVIMNRMLNFVIWPDEPKIVNGKPVAELENLRLLMETLVNQGTPGFDKPLPEYRPSEIYHPLGSPEDPDETQELRKELHLLRIAEKESMKLFLEDVDNHESREGYKNAKNLLEEFKERYPLHYKWRSFANGEIDNEYSRIRVELDELEEEIDEEIRDLSFKKRAIEKRIWSYKRW